MFCFVDDANKIGYYPIHKNGSTSFSKLAKNLGWRECEDMELLIDEYKIFSHIRDPIERFYAGTTEYIMAKGLEYTLEDSRLTQLWCSALMDIHSYPITWTLGPLVKKIFWIPMHKEVDMNLETLEFLRNNNVHADSVPHEYAASDKARTIRTKLMDLHTQNDKYVSLSCFYEHDYKLWYKALDEFLYKKTKWKDGFVDDGYFFKYYKLD